MATATLIHTDEETQKDVLAELKWDAQVQPNEIGVSVKDGVVTLTGWVDSYLKKWAAEDAAHRVGGVKGVSNLIAVKPSTTPSELKKRIENALVRNAKVDANKITVEVQGSKAILKGAVRAWVEKKEAERVAWLAPGVTSVENRITLK